MFYVKPVRSEWNYDSVTWQASWMLERPSSLALAVELCHRDFWDCWAYWRFGCWELDRLCPLCCSVSALCVPPLLCACYHVNLSSPYNVSSSVPSIRAQSTAHLGLLGREWLNGFVRSKQFILYLLVCGPGDALFVLLVVFYLFLRHRSCKNREEFVCFTLRQLEFAGLIAC